MVVCVEKYLICDARKDDNRRRQNTLGNPWSTAKVELRTERCQPVRFRSNDKKENSGPVGSSVKKLSKALLDITRISEFSRKQSTVSTTVSKSEANTATSNVSLA